MEESVEVNHGTKRDAIAFSDDDTPNEQPTVRSAPESVPSAEVLQLRQQLLEKDRQLLEKDQQLLEKDMQLLEKDKKLQTAVKIAGEHKARALFLENLVDNKNDVKGEAAKATEEEEQKKREETLQNEIEELRGENRKWRSTETRLMSKIDDLEGRLREYEPAEVPNNNQSIRKKEEPIEAQETTLPAPPIPPLESIPPDDSPPGDNVSTVPTFTHPPPKEKKEEPIEAEEIAARDDEGQIENGEVQNGDVNSAMDTVDFALEDSLNDPPLNDDESPRRTMQPSDLMDYHMNFDDEMSGDLNLPLEDSRNDVSMSIEDVDSEINGEERNSLADGLIDNEGKEDNGHSTDIPTDTSETVRMDKKGRASRRVMNYNDDSDTDEEPSMKKLRVEHTKKADNKGKSNKGRDKSNVSSGNLRVMKINATELECPECEFRTRSANALMVHLRLKHSTTPKLSGIAFLCECGNESVSHGHSRKCNRANTTVIRKRDGPIRRLDDEKAATPQCVLCEMYPKTACGYVDHLNVHHKRTLRQNGIYLICSCGLEVRSTFIREKHLQECDPRQFTLHKLDDE